MVLNTLSKQEPKFYTTFVSMVVFFALVYAAIDWNEKHDKNNRTKYFQYGSMKRNTPLEKISNYMYLSVTNLTTLGLGDIYPVHPLSQLFMGLETFSTFIMISKLIS